MTVDQHQACYGATDSFFAENPDELDAARALCQHCEQQDSCALRALAAREHHGIWGGVNFGDRGEVRALIRLLRCGGPQR